MPSKEEVMNALTECYDPEIPGVKLQAWSKHVPEGAADTQDVEIEMTMTSPGCPSHVGISEDVRRKVQVLPGVNSVNVNVVWTPPWSPERLSPAARQKLGIE